MSKHNLILKENEVKESAKKSFREKLNDNGKVQYNDIYSCSLSYTVNVQVYDKNAYNELLDQDLVLYSKGVHEGNLNWDGFQDELSYLKDAFDYSDFSMLMSLQNGRLYIDIVSDKDGDTVMDMTIKAKFVQ